VSFIYRFDYIPKEMSLIEEEKTLKKTMAIEFVQSMF
jgi:hypothetical protein